KRNRAPLPQAARQLEAVHARHVDVEHREIRAFGLEGRERLRTVRGLDHEEPGLLQRERGDRQEVRVVVDEQDLHGLAPTGSSTHARVPVVGARRRDTRPPWRSTIERTMYSPSPRPLSSGSSPPERMNCRKSTVSSSVFGPGPWSSIQNSIPPLAAGRAWSRMAVSAGPNLLALTSR